MPNDSYAKVSIHGSCVSRDLFEFQKEDGIKISEYIARNSILSTTCPPVKMDEDFYAPGNWQKRMVQIDCGKTLFSRLQKSGADFLLLDLIDERFSLNVISNSYITWSGGAKALLPFLAENLQHGMTFSEDQLKEKTDAYCKEIIKIFDSSEIILFKAMFLEKYISKDGSIKFFSDEKRRFYSKLNHYLEFLFKELEHNLKCRIVSLPQNAIADENNKWGLAPMHYSSNTYSNTLDAITSIFMKEKK